MSHPEDLFDYASLGDTIFSEGHAIRLVRLIAGSGPLIQCAIFKAYIHEEGIPYESLSYTWGDQTRRKKITLNDKAFYVTHNLFEALQHLRYEDEDRILWIDAICIDQNMYKEKNHQVMHIPSIYRDAQQTIFWLGPADYQVLLLFSALQRLKQRATRLAYTRWNINDSRWLKLWNDEPTTHETQNDYLIGLRAALNSAWFRRVWILQECAHAKTGIVVCGRRSISARFFVLAPKLLSLKPLSHCQAVLDLMPGFRNVNIEWKQPSLYTLLLDFKDSEASDKRDKIYALLSIASDGTAYPEVDYGKSMRCVAESLYDHVFPDFFDWRGAVVALSLSLEEPTSNLRGLNDLAMIAAAARGDLKEFKELNSRAGANPNYINMERESALSVAVEHHWIEVVEYILSLEGINVAVANRSAQTPLHVALQHKESDIAKLLLPMHENSYHDVDVFGASPLHYAIQNEDVDIIELMNDRDQIHPLPKSTGALNTALQRRNLVMYRSLQKYFLTEVEEALAFAVRNFDEDLYRHVFNSTDLSSMRKGISRTNGTLAASIRQCREPLIVNAVHKSGQTMLMLAAELNNKDLVSALRTNPRCDVNARDRARATALIIACTQQATEAVHELLKHSNINVNAQSENGSTALTIAIARGSHNRAIIEGLLAKKNIDMGLRNVGDLSVQSLATHEPDAPLLDLLNQEWPSTSTSTWKMPFSKPKPPPKPAAHVDRLRPWTIFDNYDSSLPYVRMSDNHIKEHIRAKILEAKLDEIEAEEILRDCGVSLRTGLKWTYGDFLSLRVLETWVNSNNIAMVSIILTARLVDQNSLRMIATAPASTERNEVITRLLMRGLELTSPMYD